MRCGFITIAIYFFTSLLNLVQAQQNIFKNYTINDGLASNSIRSIFQDSKGFLWIGTWEGISRYDGYTFTNYNTANGLSDNMVNDFYESENGQLYVALNNGSIDIISENRILQNHFPPSAVVNHFTHSPGRPVIVCTDHKGLQKFREGKLYQPKQSFPANSYTDVLWLNDSLFISASDSFVVAVNSNFELYSEIKGSPLKFTDSKIYQDSKKRIWIGTPSGLCLLAGIPQKNQPITFAELPAAFTIPELQKRRINDIYEGVDGIMWFGTSGGLVKINPDGSHQLITVSGGLASNIITSIFQDKEKNIWFGTAVGLSKLVTRCGIQLFPLENGIWPSDYLYLLNSVKKNFLLVSTVRGNQVFNKLNGWFSPVVSQPFFYDVVANTNPPLFSDGNTLATFDTLSFRFTEVMLLPLKLGVRLIKDKNSCYFISNLQQLFFCSAQQYQKILDYRITGLVLDKRGDLWVGTWQNGLFRIRYQYIENKLEIIAKEQFLPEENIRSLFEDTKGTIWVGTRYTGIYRIEKAENGKFSISKFDQHKGLSSNFIKTIREDKKGNIWIAFYQGLDKLIPQDSSFRIFNFSRVNNYFTSVVGMEMDADGSIWLATGEGLTHIVDGEMEKLPPLPVYITKVFSPDSVYPLYAHAIQLNYRQNQLQFEFSSPGFINEKQVVYSYRLYGSSDTTWTAANNQHIVSYASLQPGNYHFEVRTQGWNGAWGKPAAIAFIIDAPFWQTGWFRIVCALLTVLIIYQVIRKRIQRIQHEADMKQRITETEMMALRAQMNPHFIFNCLNSIDNLIQMNEKEKATSYLSKFAKLIRSILENSKANVVPCWKDMETLQLYLELEALRFDHKFSYNIDVDDAIINGDYKVPPLIIQPFVENAIHHGLLNKIEQDKKLYVRVSVVNNHIIYLIEDNGVGRVQAAAYKKLNKPAYGSMGMQITADRINLYNQHQNGAVKVTDLYNTADMAVGTSVEVSLIIQP